MTKRFASLLRRIVGRIKEYMLVGALALSFMLIPIGYYFLIEGKSYTIGVIGEATVVIGFILFIIAFIKTIQEESRKNNEGKQRFDSLMTEIRGLRQELNDRTRQDRDE